MRGAVTAAICGASCAAVFSIHTIAAAGQTAATGIIDPPLSPRNASYTIQARLDPSTRTITGSETIRWRNITASTATELRFHLYWNAWKNTRSTYMHERALAGENPPEADHRPDEWARIDITSVRQVDPAPADLTALQHFIAPDDGNTEDETVMAVPLPQPAAPSATVTIHLEWRAHVPRTFDRTGAIGNFFFIAQWFPKLGVLEDDGWNCHQFHAATEFFSDYGTYDVSVTIPRRWPLGATGVEREARENADGTTTHRFYQDDVHDFAWTASPDYIVRVAEFDPRGQPGEKVEMRLLLQPEHLGQAERHFDATRTTLKYYGEWFGRYPYGHITIVDPAYQSDAGGMEYPTLFTAGTRWLAPAGVTTPEDVIVHEAGHQFWYGIVGNNEFEHAWMDEGLNTFSTARAVAQVYTPNYLAVRYFGGFVPWVFKDIPLSRETDGNRLSGYRREAKTDVPATPTYRYFPATAAAITYDKTALWLNTLERMLGWPTLQRAMAEYFDRWKFKHPKPQDFFDVVSRVAGRDQEWFFDQVYRGSNVFDYGVQELLVEPENGRSRSTVVVRRYGEALFPVDVQVNFADGSTIRERWDGRDRWTRFTYDRAAPVVSATVDPGRVLLLDVDYTNNSKTVKPEAASAATKWSMTWLVWLEHCVLAWASLA